MNIINEEFVSFTPDAKPLSVDDSEVFTALKGAKLAAYYDEIVE